MKFLMFLMTLNTLNMMFLSHPMMMTMSLIMMTTMICLLMNLMNYYLWFSYIMFLIIIGSLMILFLYMSNLTSNKLIILNLKKILFFILFFLLFFTFFYFQMKNIFILLNNQKSPLILAFMMKFNEIEPMMNMNKLYNNYSLEMSILMMILLLWIMLISIKISNLKKGPFRMKF